MESPSGMHRQGLGTCTVVPHVRLFDSINKLILFAVLLMIGPILIFGYMLPLMNKKGVYQGPFRPEERVY